MADYPDHYVVLGVHPTASLKEIREAYRRRVQVLHPDRFDRDSNPSAWAHANAMLRELNEAFAVLSSPSRRRAYDLAHGVERKRRQESGRDRRNQEPPSAPTTTDTRPAAPSWETLTRFGLIVLGVFVVSFLFGVVNRGGSSTRQEPVIPRNDPGPAPATSRESPSSDRAPELSESASPYLGCEPRTDSAALPRNGEVWRPATGEPLAPLEIRVRGSQQYLVKLEQGGRTHALMFVRGGSSAEMLVPLGAYTLKYATGSGDYWCGENSRLPFGVRTAFSRAEEVFYFRQEGNQYLGYTVELYLQDDGNLNTVQIDADMW